MNQAWDLAQYISTLLFLLLYYLERLFSVVFVLVREDTVYPNFAYWENCDFYPTFAYAETLVF